MVHSDSGNFLICNFIVSPARQRLIAISTLVRVMSPTRNPPLKNDNRLLVRYLRRGQEISLTANNSVSQKMKARFATAYFAFHLATLLARAEWKELKNDGGHVVEIVVDLRIEDLRIDAKESTSFTAKAMVDGEELGFSATLSKPREGTIGELSVMRTDIDVRSVGPSTKRLEGRLNAELGVATASEGPTRVVGLYAGYCPNFAALLEGTALVHGHSVGITYDEHDHQVSGQCYAIKFIVDAPLSRLTAYFHEEGGYGGTAPADRARIEWYDSRRKKGAKPDARANGRKRRGSS